MNDSHTHKGEQELKDAFRLDDLAALERNKKRSQGPQKSSAQAATPVAAAPGRQSLLGSPGTTRSTDIEDDKKKRRSGTLLMP